MSDQTKGHRGLGNLTREVSHQEGSHGWTVGLRVQEGALGAHSGGEPHPGHRLGTWSLLTLEIVCETIVSMHKLISLF